MALIPRGYRIYCNAKLPKEVTINGETLVLDVDGTQHEITLKQGTYTTLHAQFESDLPSMITSTLQEEGIPVLCRLGGIYDFSNNRTVLVFEHTDVESHHDLTVTGGTGYSTLVGSVYDSDSHEDGIFDEKVDLDSHVSIVYKSMSEMMSDLSARRSTKTDTNSQLTVRLSNESDLSGDIYVVSASRLEGYLVIRKSDTSDLDSSLAVPTDDKYDLGSFLTVG